MVNVVMAFKSAAGLILVNLLSTAIFQAPAHMKLMSGFNLGAVRRLIFTNWVRTLAWTARGVLLASVVMG